MTLFCSTATVKRWIAPVCCIVAIGCAGYKLGPANRPAYRSVAVKMFQNRTLYPQIESQISNAIIKRFQSDGTLRVEPEDQADVTITGQITAYRRQALRASRSDTGVPREYRVSITVRIEVRGRDGQLILKSTALTGNADTFIGSDLQSADLQVLPLVAEDLARQIVAQVADRW